MDPLPIIQPAASAPKSSESAIHPLSAVLLIVIDNLWNLADWAALLWIVTIPLSFLMTFVPVFFIQKFVHRDQAGFKFLRNRL